MIVAWLRRLGIDRAIAVTLMGYVWMAIAGPATIFMVATTLTPREQGVFYTFGSLIGLNMFFELGLGFVLVQMVAHECPKLEIRGRNCPAGSPEALGRVGDLFRMATRWYQVASACMILVVLPFGGWFLKSGDIRSIEWQWPWFLLVTGTAANLAVTSLLPMMEGTGQISMAATVKTLRGVFAHFAVWSVLAFGGKLYAPAAYQWMQALVVLVWALGKWRAFYSGLWRSRCGQSRLNWRKEVWPFQWRIAISWCSGYLSLQLFTPLLFKYRGAIEAGQMGMSMTVCLILLSMAIAWVETKGPRMGYLVSSRRFPELDTLFNGAAKRSLGVMVVLGLLFWAAVRILCQVWPALGTRFLPPLELALLITATLLLIVVSIQAVYLRAHKREPFLWLSILGTPVSCLIYLSVTPRGGVTGQTIAFCLANVAGVSIASVIFRRCRTAWHSTPPKAISPTGQEPS